MIDTHAHLFLMKKLPEDVLAAAEQAGVSYIVNVGIDIASSRASALSAAQFSQVVATAGVHPSSTHDMNNMDELETLLQEYQFSALGEIGLDYYWDHTPKQTQIEIFEKQLQLAEKYQLPVIIHNRHADDDACAVLQSFKALKKVFHCYSSNVDFATLVMDENTYFSFTGMITYANKGKVIETIRFLPLEKIMIETDSPYLTPQKYKGKKNEPAYLIEIAKKIALVKDISVDQVLSQTTENARSFFKIK